jgi:hypothetical protein
MLKMFIYKLSKILIIVFQMVRQYIGYINSGIAEILKPIQSFNY